MPNHLSTSMGAEPAKPKAERPNPSPRGFSTNVVGWMGLLGPSIGDALHLIDVMKGQNRSFRIVLAFALAQLKFFISVGFWAVVNYFDVFHNKSSGAYITSVACWIFFIWLWSCHSVRKRHVKLVRRRGLFEGARLSLFVRWLCVFQFVFSVLVVDYCLSWHNPSWDTWHRIDVAPAK